MTYTIVDHGVWRAYKPEPMPEWAVAAATVGGSIVFFQRDGDSVDFYEWIKAAPFAADAVVAQTTPEGSNDETVRAVFRDASMLQPFNQRVIEIQGVDPNEVKPHNLFAWLTYHPDTKLFSGEATPPQPPPAPVVTFKKDIWVRAADAEAETIEQVLSQQSLRKQRIYAEAQYLDHPDALYGELYAGFVQAFGRERADQLLAGPSS